MLGKVAVFLAMYAFAFAQPDAAQAAFEAGRFTEARTILETRRDAASAAWLARTYLQLQLTENAMASARRAEATGSHLPDVQHQLALFYAQSGKRLLAARWEDRFASSPAADAAAPLRAALLFAEVRQWPDAMRLGRLALRKQDRPEVRRLLASGAEALGQSAEAVAHQRALVAQLPYDETVHAGLGQLLLRLGKFGEAAVALEEAERK